MMKRFFLNIAFNIMKLIPYSILKNVIKNNGKPMTKSEHAFLVNSSTDEILRSMGLVKSAKEKMPLNSIAVKRNFSPDSLGNIKESLRELADKNNFYIGVAAEIDEYGLKNNDCRELIVKEFNSFTFENSMKWNKTLKDAESENIFDYDFAEVDKQIDFLLQHNMRIRGHALIWGKFGGMTFPRYVQKFVDKSNNPKKALEEIIYQRVTGTVNHFKGRVKQWDVVNESMPYDGDFRLDGYFNEIMGEEYIVKSFKFAREADPNSSLTLNEAFGKTSGEKAKQYLQWIKHLKDIGTPIDSVGIQGHVTRGSFDVEGINFFAKELANLGVQMDITEFDISAVPFRECEDMFMAQAQYTYDILKSAAESNNLGSITFWGLSDKKSWYDDIYPFNLHKPNYPNPFDKNLEKKPMYYAVQSLLKDKIRRGE